MNLKSVGETFAEAHPIINVLSDTRFVFAVIVLMFICIVVQTSYRIERKNKFIDICLTITTNVIILITISLGICIFIRATYFQDITYSGQAKVTSIGSINDDLEQTIELENDDGRRTLKIDKEDIEGIKKGNKINMSVTFHRDTPSVITPFYEDGYYINSKTKKPKKHLNFENITDLEDRIKLTKSN